MKSKRVWIQGAVVVLVITGLCVTYAMAQCPSSKKACSGSAAKVAAITSSGSCSSATKAACASSKTACASKSACASKAACASKTACTSKADCASKTACASKAKACAVAAKQCPVNQFMTRLQRLDLSEAQIGEMMGIWKATEKKLLGVLTAEQLVQMNKPLSTPKQVTAKASCCGTCGGGCGGVAKVVQ